MCIATKVLTTIPSRTAWAARRREESPVFRGPVLPWWAHATAEERRAAIEAKLNREQPLPTYSHGH